MIADEPGIVKILGMRLRENAFQIIITHDGAMAIALAQHEKPVLIVLDIRMSGKNGCSLFQDLRESVSARSIPIVFFSALPSEQAQEKATQLGTDSFVSKSADPDKILTKITEILDQAESQPAKQTQQ